MKDQVKMERVAKELREICQELTLKIIVDNPLLLIYNFFAIK